MQRRHWVTASVAVVILATVSAVFLLGGPTPTTVTGCGTTSAGAPDLCGESSWINSDGEDLQALADEDRVVLVDFWTYSCINCIRTFPHLTALYDTYSPYGFTIIGVHSPEFEFEKERSNVEEAIEEHGIRYPVVQDNGFRIWRNYENRYWPAHYLYDADGDLRDFHAGEGKYAETEALVRQLLEEAGAGPLPDPIEPLGDGAGARHGDITPELYAGYGRQSEAIGNPEGYSPDQDVTYNAEEAPERDRIYLDGTWHNAREHLRAVGSASFLLRFHAGAVNFVIEVDEPACVPITLDGAPVPVDLRGGDVVEAEDGTTCVQAEGADSFDLYAGPVEEHVLQVHVPDGFDLYTFAFSAYAQE